MVVARADDLADRREMRVGEFGDDGRRLSGPCGFRDRHGRPPGSCDSHSLPTNSQQSIPCSRNIATACSGGVGRDQHLLDDAEGRQVGLDDRAGIIAAERQLQAQRLDHHAQPERRAAAADRKRDAACVQPLDRRDRARGQHLVVRDEGAVDIGDDQRDASHRRSPFRRASGSRRRLAEATTTAELRPRNSPFSTTPTVMLIACSGCRGSAIGAERAVEDEIAAIGDEGRPSLCRSSGLAPSFSSAAAVACQPNCDDLDRHRHALAEPVDELLVIDHDDETLARRRDDLLAQQRAATSLDQVEACRAATSSAPSIARSIRRCSRKARERDAEPARHAPPCAPRSGSRRPQSPCATRRRQRSTTNAAVEPVPSPSTMPLSTNSTARSAAARFRWSRSRDPLICGVSPAGGAEWRIAAIAAA